VSATQEVRRLESRVLKLEHEVLRLELALKHEERAYDRLQAAVRAMPCSCAEDRQCLRCTELDEEDASCEHE